MASTKELKDFLKLSGKKRNPIILESKLLNLGLNPLKIEILLTYLDVIVNSNILDPMNYDFFVNGASYKELEDKYHKNNVYVSNKISRGIDTFFDTVGINVYQEVLETDAKNVSKLKAILRHLKDLQIEYKHVSNHILDQLVVDLNDYFPLSNPDNPNMTQEDIILITNKLNLLSKEYLSIVINALDKDQLGHIKYLLETEDRELSTTDVLLKKQFIKRMFLKDD